MSFSDPMTGPMTADTPDLAENTRTTEDDSPETPRSRILDLSATQLVASSLAAATAAGLGSRLGVVGTITGAAVGSVITAVAASVYTTSMTRARDVLLATRALGRRDAAVPRLDWWRVTDRTRARRLLATTGLVFLVAAAFLTGLQLATGASVTGTSIGTRAQAAPVREAARPSRADASAPTAPVGPTGTPAPSSTGPQGGGTGTATAPVVPAAPGAATGTATGTAGPTGAPTPATQAPSATPTSPAPTQGAQAG